MSRITEYCNITTDLQEVLKHIESYSYQEINNDLFTSVSGEVYSEQGQTGYVGVLYMDRISMSGADSLAEIDETNIWYYDTDNDVLYVHSDAIGSNSITIAPMDWKSLKEKAREDASQELENYLSSIYNVPLPYRKDSDKEFDRDIVRACAILTCKNIVATNNPQDELVNQLQAMVYDRREESGIIWDYLNGIKKFSFEATRQTHNGRITPVSVSGTGGIEAVGVNQRTDYNYYEIEITTGGPIGTAKYQLSQNGTVISTCLTDYIYRNMPHGEVYIRFFGTFTVGDKWKLEYDGRLKQQNEAGIGSIRMV